MVQVPPEIIRQFLHFIRSCLSSAAQRVHPVGSGMSNLVLGGLNGGTDLLQQFLALFVRWPEISQIVFTRISLPNDDLQHTG